MFKTIKNLAKFNALIEKIESIIDVVNGLCRKFDNVAKILKTHGDDITNIKNIIIGKKESNN